MSAVREIRFFESNASLCPYTDGKMFNFEPDFLKMYMVKNVSETIFEIIILPLNIPQNFRFVAQFYPIQNDEE
jgi:hypothetical protein